MRIHSAGVVATLVSLALAAGAPLAAASGPGATTDPHPDGTSAARLAPRAGGAVTLGEVKGGQLGCVFGAAYGITSDLEDPARPSYVASSPGVLTSFTTYSGVNGQSVQALVLKDGADATHKLVAAKSADVAVPANSLYSWPTRLPIKAGERIGLGFSTTGTVCWFQTSAADSAWASSPFDADTTSDFAHDFALPGGRPNVSAVLEPDVDGDGYGDISQDLCPQSKLAQVACPAPDTKLTKKPRQTPGVRRIVIRFASVPGATYTCAVNGANPRPCKSPFKKYFKDGKHVVRINATSPYGIVETKPLKVRFTIRNPKA